MRTLYFDCRAGISGDMVLNALIDMQDDSQKVRTEIERIYKHINNMTHDESHDAHFHRSYRDVIQIIEAAFVTQSVKERAYQIYDIIAKAEGKVHGKTKKTLHFHEVGRVRAIVNIIGAAYCMEQLKVDSIICSEIYDGYGTVKCAHGEIQVPVPAVMAMRENCDLRFKEVDIEGEMVTPTGLAMLIGLGTKNGEPEGEKIKTVESKGSRKLSLDRGLIVSLYEN